MSQLLTCYRYVRPGKGFLPNFQLFAKGDVNGEKEQEIFTFLKVSEWLEFVQFLSSSLPTIP